MSRPAHVDASVPAGLRDLLDAFREAYGCPALRLLTRSADGWHCVYPGGDTLCDRDAAALSHPVEVRKESWVLEATPGTIESAGLAFLARVISRAITQEREAESAARELTERYEEINLLYTISETLGSVLSVTDAASRILGEVADVLGARRASLWVYRPDEDVLDLAAAVGEDGLRGPIRASETGSVTARVFREKEPLNLERGAPEGWRDTKHADHEAFLSVPISYTPPDGGSRTVGVITLVGRRGGSMFSAGDARLLAAIASQVGAALETQRLVQESLRQERMVRELELAHDLQLKLLPDPHAFEGAASLAARCEPADSVGGDFYQLYRLPGGRLGIMIGDVSSHGFAAALIMALVMSAAGIHALEAGAPAEVLQRVYAALHHELESTEMYLSLFYGVIDAGKGRIVWANAGHPQAFHIAEDGTDTRLGATGPPLGLAPGDRYGQDTRDWSPGDLLLLFTDGLSDSLSTDSVSGEVRLLEEVIRRRGDPLEQTVRGIFRLSDQTPRRLPPDDRTLLLVRA